MNPLRLMTIVTLSIVALLLQWIALLMLDVAEALNQIGSAMSGRARALLKGNQ